MGNKYYEFDDAKKLIKSFLDSQFPECDDLDEQLKKLQLFSFWDITEKEKYRNNKYYIDGDCTNLAYAIAWCLWENDIKQCVDDKEYTFKDLLRERFFSGDTICTWKTLLNDPRIDPRESSIINYSEKEKKDILYFYKLYQSIGNFYLLPNKTLNFTSLNKYRGNYNGLKDYFDTFRDKLQLKQSEEEDQTIEQLIVKNNHFFGERANSWEKLRDTFFLSDTERLKFEGKHYNHSELTENNKEEYKKFVLDFVRQSTKMIEDRSKTIIEKLSKVLE